MAPATHKQRLPPHRYSCLFCERQFRWNRDLETHMNTHTNERPYVCTECDATFMNNSTMGVHMRADHFNVKYKCDICGLSFNNSTSRSAHRRSAHKLKVGTGRKRKHGGRRRRAISSGSSDSLESDEGSESEVESAVITRRRSSVKLEEIQEKGNLCFVKLEPLDISQLKVEAVNGTVNSNKFKSARSSGVVRRGRQPGWRKPVVGVVKQEESFRASVPPPPVAYDPLEEVLNYNERRHKELTESKWDPSFFLHLNRYNPEDSCFSSNYLERATAKPKEVVKVKKKMTPPSAKAAHSTSPGKKGRPCKIPEAPCISPAQLKTVQSEDIQKLDKGNVKCPFCPRILHSSNLHAHLLIHTGEKPFNCTFCKCRFRQKSHLIKHVVRYHRWGRDIGKPGRKHYPVNLEEETDISCAFCGDVFNNRNFLEQHLLRAHKETLQRKGSDPIQLNQETKVSD